MPKIIHGADFHLDSAFSSLPAKEAKARRQEGRVLMDQLADLAEREGTELVLLSGDLFDGGRVYPETLGRLRLALARMGCPVFIAPGNHDPAVKNSPYVTEDWPDNVHIFLRPELEAVEVPELGCVVYGAAFTGPDRTDAVLEGFQAPADGRTHLLCLHGDALMPDSQYGPVAAAQLAASGLRYAALGHYHQFGGVQRAGGTFWAYPGCVQGRGFDELGEKGVLAGWVDPSGVELRFVPLEGSRYHILQVDVTGREPLAALEAALPETAERDFCRLTLTGEAEAPGVDLTALEKALKGRCRSLELRDQTRTAEDVWSRAGEDSLRGMFLQALTERYDAAGAQEKEDILWAVKFGLAALEGREM